MTSKNLRKAIWLALAASLALGDGFMKKGGAFLTNAAVAGKTPALTIQANISLGSLALRVT